MPTQIQHFIGGKLGRRPQRPHARRSSTRRPASRAAPCRWPARPRSTRRWRWPRAAFPAWAMTTPLRRARILNRFLRLLEENQDADRRDDHRRARQGLFRRRWARSRAASRWSSSRPARRSCSRARSPRMSAPGSTATPCASRSGVVAGITPFNFPAMVPMWMFPVALACGNCFILKVSEKVPSAALILAELLKEAGVPGRRVPGRPRRQGGGRRDPAPSRHRGGQLRRLDPDRQLHLRDRGHAREALPGAGRGQEPHDRHARRRPRPGGRRADGCGLRRGRRALHGDLGGGADRRPGRRRADRAAGAEGARR